MNSTKIASDGCIAPDLGDALTAYCFGALSDVEQEAVEAHLAECEACWTEFRQLEASVTIVQSDARAQPAFAAHEVVPLLGLAGRLDHPFGGHRAFTLVASVLFGLLWGAGIATELGYSYDRFHHLLWVLAGPVAIAAAGSLITAVWLAVRTARSGNPRGLLMPGLWLLASLGLLTLVLVATLPVERTIMASFQTRTAATGYFKDVLLIFAPLLLLILPPLHSVVVLQRALGEGRYQQVLNALRPNEAIAPRGTWFLPLRALATYFVVMALLKILGANNMLDALSPGPYANLFAATSYVSTGLVLAIGVVALRWYSRCLNELRREAHAMESLAAQTNRSL